MLMRGESKPVMGLGGGKRSGGYTQMLSPALRLSDGMRSSMQGRVTSVRTGPRTSRERGVVIRNANVPRGF